MSASFSITWDYRCPFARIVHDHVVTGLQGGADWDVTFVPFSLDQSHVDELETPVWEHPDDFPGLLANQVGIVVRDRYPEKFLGVHRAIFEARHSEARDTRDRKVLSAVLEANRVDAADVFSQVGDGWPLKTFREEHEAAVAEHEVFGVPTFVVGDSATFVRLMEGPRGDAQVAKETIDKVLDLFGWPVLNEFKHTTIRS